MTVKQPARLNYRETLYELRRARNLLEDGKIDLRAWCASVHRILAAFNRGALTERQV